MEPVTVTDERTLPAALDGFYNAVAGLVDPRKELFNGAVLAAPSLYETLVGEIPAKGGDFGGRFNGRSIPPVYLDAVDLRTTIDARVKSWLPRGDSTPGRLRRLASRRWRPQDVRLVRDYADEVASWSVSITALIEPEHVKTISAPCPSCGARWFYKNHAGEQVRTPALQLVISQGASCLKCKVHYPPDRYLWLCRLLGFDLPAGVVVDQP